jgi:hypothetical protein
MGEPPSSDFYAFDGNTKASGASGVSPWVGKVYFDDITIMPAM